MKTQKFKSEEEWLVARQGRITGTRAGELVSKRDPSKKKSGFYEIIAERIAIPASDENVMDRGHRLEIDAISRFQTETKKRVNTDLVIWSREDNQDIAVSPDGFMGKTEAVEVKCLSSARHIEVWLTKNIPSEYEEQVLQYFVVNDALKTLYFVFYDPRMPKDFFYFTVKRADVKEKVAEYLELERQILLEIAQIEQELTF